MEFPNLLGKKVVHCKIKKGQNFEGKSCRTEKRNETGEGLAKNGIYFRWKKKVINSRQVETMLQRGTFQVKLLRKKVSLVAEEQKFLNAFLTSSVRWPDF
jgi:hypothetical protein